jgi:hypothetical protein
VLTKPDAGKFQIGAGLSKSSAETRCTLSCGCLYPLHGSIDKDVARRGTSRVSRWNSDFEKSDYSSFFSGSLGSAFSMGLRGSIWSRMAAS